MMKVFFAVVSYKFTFLMRRNDIIITLNVILHICVRTYGDMWSRLLINLYFIYSIIGHARAMGSIINEQQH